MNTTVTPAPTTSVVASQDSNENLTPAPASTSFVASQDSDKNPTTAPATSVVASQGSNENPTPAPATSIIASQNSDENPTNQETTNDVVMGDAAAPAQKPQDDENLPPWLAAKIKYLREVTDDTVWQNLVTDFVDFEKGGPPNGVSSFTLFFFV